MNDPRGDLLRIYEAGVRRVRGFDAVRVYLEAHSAPRSSGGKCHLVAIGKAASAMARGALAANGERIADGLVITKHDHVEDELARVPRIECIESDHPVPGEATLRAGERLLEYLAECTGTNDDAGFLFLLSGGASSLVEVPAKGMTLDDLQQLNEQLLAGGLDIGRMNRARRTLSGIKGGRLAPYLHRRPTLNLMISDVPDDDPGIIGSGLLTPVRETPDPHDRGGLGDTDEWPDAVRALLERAETVPVPDEVEFAAIEPHIVACLDDARKACRDEAATLGYGVRPPDLTEPTFVEGDIEDAAVSLHRELEKETGTISVWGGEPTVKLPANPGRGGRNQQLALAVALKIQGDSGAYFLSAGTDGTDGPTADAGALVDGGSIARGRARGLDAENCLQRADAGVFLEASGDLVTTGPTGTNVMDLMLGYRKAGT